MTTAAPSAASKPEPLLDELADRLAVAPQQPGIAQKRMPRATMHDAMNSQMFTPIAPDDDRHDLHRRQMREAGRDQHQQAPASRLAESRSSSNFARLP